MSGIATYILIIILIFVSAFFSASEIAYSSVNKRRIKKQAESGKYSAKLACKITDKYDKTLSAILVGNNLANIAASSVSAMIAFRIAKSFGISKELGATISTIVITLLILLFSEIVPKVISSEHADSIAVAFAVPMRFVAIILTPAVWCLTGIVNLVSKIWNKGEQEPSVTEEELISIIETIEDEGVIDEDRSELLQSAIEFPEITAQEILTPRVDMISIDIDDDFDEIVKTAMDSPYTRIPVYEDSIDNIIGILHLNHFLKSVADGKKINIRSMLMDVCYIHKTMHLPMVLAELKRRKTHLAVVTDEYGGTMGIVTMEDVLEQIVGEIWDETDEIVDEIINVSENTYEVSGDMSIFDLLDYFDINEDKFDSEYVTVGGLAIEMLDDYPEIGESFEFENLTLTVKEIDDMRVTKLTVVVTPKSDDDEDDDDE